MHILEDKYIYTSTAMCSNKDAFICPITHQIFKDPVIAFDGIFYERKAIEDWFKNNNISPTTRQIIDKTIISSILFNNLLKEYLEKNPEELKNQYVYEINEIIFNYYINKNDLIELKKYMSLYNNIVLSFFDETRLKNNGLAKILIDHQININNKNNYLLIHYICRFSTPEMIKYIIDKGVDLECTTAGGWKPIHLICRYSTPEMIKYIIDKGVDLESTNNKKMKPIDYLRRHSTPEMINYIECANKKMKPYQSMYILNNILNYIT
jgi:ankyrin repeat protein